MQPILILSTCPDREVAERIARLLLEKSEAACIQILPGVESHYRWNHKLERSSEVLLFIKSTESQWENISRTVAENHPYECPELVKLKITGGFPAYLAWMADSLKVEDASADEGAGGSAFLHG